MRVPALCPVPCALHLPALSGMLWRHARSAYQLATAPGTTAAEKTALLQEALTMIKSAVHLDGGDSESHRWFGTILQESSSSQGYSQQIADAFEVKSQWETAVTINPDDSAAQHLLGRWCLTVTDMPWYSRQLAATLFAEPPSSTYDEARDYFAAAERISPGFWKANVYFLGVVADRMGNREEALEWMVKAAALPVLTADDEEYQAKTLASLYSWDSAAYAKAKKAEDARVALKAQLAQ